MDWQGHYRGGDAAGQVGEDGPERSWQRNLQIVRGVLTDAQHGEIWDFNLHS